MVLDAGSVAPRYNLRPSTSHMSLVKQGVGRKVLSSFYWHCGAVSGQSSNSVRGGSIFCRMSRRDHWGRKDGRDGREGGKPNWSSSKSSGSQHHSRRGHSSVQASVQESSSQETAPTTSAHSRGAPQTGGTNVEYRRSRSGRGRSSLTAPEVVPDVPKNSILFWSQSISRIPSCCVFRRARSRRCQTPFYGLLPQKLFGRRCP